ncbi:MAG: DNA repair protein RadC [Candidatus Latescibacteria bacterium]|nr:DNA repair protein RadC [Candidatus Latescibacterota bacterium]NIO27288.1 DNA repair protein RadC [Candidatus Latescibacterota bacterium]NIO54812.1 DNA repair protein RadC [Candidatus Latescibacterota bacterium]NIT00895.1 DNA repair protein RadC [Candidatus Latescibacterota bacterium]NIT37818.1 DNA repair protein RadC [Candidatus Latescibacterota bacterium]
MNGMSVKGLPPGDRPRERLYHIGAQELSLQELLSIVIGSGSKGAGALAVAYRLLETFGDLPSLGKADLDDLKCVTGIGFARACQLAAAFELGKRLVRESGSNGALIKSPRDVARIFMDEMKHYDREHFKAAFLNTKNQVIKTATISIGSLNASIVHPREILKPAISTSAASIVLVHNHPTGDPKPSKEDIEFTKRFAKCGELIGIGLLDHVIIGAGKFTSLKERGYF